MKILKTIVLSSLLVAGFAYASSMTIGVTCPDRSGQTFVGVYIPMAGADKGIAKCKYNSPSGAQVANVNPPKVVNSSGPWQNGRDKVFCFSNNVSICKMTP